MSEHTPTCPNCKTRLMIALEEDGRREWCCPACPPPGYTHREPIERPRSDPDRSGEHKPVPRVYYIHDPAKVVREFDPIAVATSVFGAYVAAMHIDWQTQGKGCPDDDTLRDIVNDALTVATDTVSTLVQIERDIQMAKAEEERARALREASRHKQSVDDVDGGNTDPSGQ